MPMNDSSARDSNHPGWTLGDLARELGFAFDDLQPEADTLRLHLPLGQP